MEIRTVTGQRETIPIPGLHYAGFPFEIVLVQKAAQATTVLVLPGETLSQFIFGPSGHYSRELLEWSRTLYPCLRDLQPIDVGQQIQLMRINGRTVDDGPPGVITSVTEAEQLTNQTNEGVRDCK